MIKRFAIPRFRFGPQFSSNFLLGFWVPVRPFVERVERLPKLAGDDRGFAATRAWTALRVPQRNFAKLKMNAAARY